METNSSLVVLGLDAAWTPHHASGVAVVVGKPGAWRCLAANSSVEALETEANCSGLLEAVEGIAGAPMTLASVDMPLALVPIAARRVCDNQISSSFGAYGCSVHSPSSDRPGPVGTDLMRKFADAEYSLAVHGSTFSGRQVLEVYPHIAVMRLLRESYRVPYKIARARQYWPDLGASERRERIRVNLARILAALNEQIADIPLILPPPETGNAALKRFEDAIDAVVCAYVGTRFLQGDCKSFGDHTAAIWVPNP